MPLMEYANTETSLLEEIKEQLLNSKDWNVSSETDKEGNTSSTEWKLADSDIKILSFNSDNDINTTVDTKLGGRTNRAFRGRFGASRVQAPKVNVYDKQGKPVKDKKGNIKQESRDANAADTLDGEELTLVYHEYKALKELIGSM